MKTIAIANQKGGVAKTHTAHALADALSQRGQTVLLIDADPQASLSETCNRANQEINLAHVLRNNTPAAEAITPLTSGSPNVAHLLPSHIELASVKLELISRLGREAELKHALDALNGRYQITIIDTPPSLSILTINALYAADAVLIPVLPQAADLRGLRLFLDSLDKITKRLNPNLYNLGILLTLYNGRYRHHQEAQQLLNQSGLPLLPVTIPKSIQVSEASAGHQSIISYAPEHKISQAYQTLASYILNWTKTA